MSIGKDFLPVPNLLKGWLGLPVAFSNWNSLQASFIRFFSCSESTAFTSRSLQLSSNSGHRKNWENLQRLHNDSEENGVFSVWRLNVQMPNNMTGGCAIFNVLRCSFFKSCYGLNGDCWCVGPFVHTKGYVSGQIHLHECKLGGTAIQMRKQADTKFKIF